MYWVLIGANIEGATRFPNSGHLTHITWPGFINFDYKQFNIFNMTVGVRLIYELE